MVGGRRDAVGIRARAGNSRARPRIASPPAGSAGALSRQAIKDPFDHWLSGNPVQANKLAGVRGRARRRAAAAAVPKRKSRARPRCAKLRLSPASSPTAPTPASEGFRAVSIVEGDSGRRQRQAGARNRKTQAILAFCVAKILNVASATKDKLTANAQLADLMQAIGCGTGAHYRGEDLRYARHQSSWNRRPTLTARISRHC